MEKFKSLQKSVGKSLKLDNSKLCEFCFTGSFQIEKMVAKSLKKWWKKLLFFYPKLVKKFEQKSARKSGGEIGGKSAQKSVE